MLGVGGGPAALWHLVGFAVLRAEADAADTRGARHSGLAELPLPGALDDPLLLAAIARVSMAGI